ncbi:PIG-L deacetylase family protein [Mycolicibacterium smegmatis]|uniref:PIG-L deacetylase family protein n=1 Tax=Mycolicibacterium smegmatis TaxID=1772 RepID=UPI001303A75A|nr:PIG-L deacetylase family protein [Mycolicibacterium smegmatis]
MIRLLAGEVDEIACVAAHCDDIAIGVGGTLLSLCRARRGVRVHALVLCGGDTERAEEERNALGDFCPDATVELTVLDIPDGRVPAHWERAKRALGNFRRTCEPDVVFSTQREDAHQDHRVLAELTPTEFRDHLILGYEILKWETDTPRPTLLHPLPADVVDQKSVLLHKHYPSQVGHDWFDDEAFRGLARLRGVQCRSRYAEAFVVEKAVIGFADRTGGRVTA